MQTTARDRLWIRHNMTLDEELLIMHDTTVDQEKRRERALRYFNKMMEKEWGPYAENMRKWIGKKWI